jgi:hypothetical protein
VRDELDRRPKTRDPEHDQENSGHERRDDEAVDSVLLDDAVDDHYESARRAADLHARSAECGDDQARDNRGPQSPARLDAARNCERDCERQRNDSDDHAGDRVAGEGLTVVAVERCEEFGD